MSKYWYELNTIDKLNRPNFVQIDESILKITTPFFENYKNLIQSSIDKFNSEISWDDMWDISEAYKRLSNNEILYLLIKNNTSIGHVWYSNNYLYNAYVSKEKPKNSSQWFISETIIDVLNNGYTKIKLNTDYWNIRAIKFWEKLGFEVINEK